MGILLGKQGKHVVWSNSPPKRQ